MNKGCESRWNSEKESKPQRGGIFVDARDVNEFKLR